MRLGVAGVALGALAMFSTEASAQVSWAGYDWSVDRYDTDVFEPNGPYQGQEDTLHIGLGPLGYGQSSFYSYQGRKTFFTPQHGSSFVTGDLYIKQEWEAGQTTNYQSTGIWAGYATDSDSTPSAYPIVAFSNTNSGPAIGRFQIWDADVGWVYVPAPVSYDAWNTLRIDFHPSDSGNTAEFYINGTLVYTDNAIGADSTTYLKEIILNSYNNGNSPYDVYWANVLAGLLVNPSNYQILGSAPGATEFYQFTAVGDFVSRRGLSGTKGFSLGNHVWSYGGGLTGDFGQYDGSAYFARFGIDVIEPSAGVRAGFTASTGHNRASGYGSAEADNYSVGGYLTYVEKDLYVEVLSEYAWGQWDISVPTEATKGSSFNSFVTSAEAGVSLWLGKNLRLVPNVQGVVIKSDYDGVDYGLVNATYESDAAVIGRAGGRVQFEMPEVFAGGLFYLGASVVKNISGGTSTVLSGPALPGAAAVTMASSTLEEAAAQFAGGFEINLAEGTRLYADGNYTTGGDVDAFRGIGGVTISW